MAGERENILHDNQYGSLVMRSYDINGNAIDAFYDAGNNLIFVLDKTINDNKSNILLVINPSSDKKWDEILSTEYSVDLETIRPKQDNKYQKLDIEYSGLDVYENLINAYVAGDDIDEELNQLNILRNSAVRHSAMTRLNTANEIISRTNVTIIKTKETIGRVQERLKALRSKLSAAKKEIGRVSTKKSAAKILRLESQIEAMNEKLKRARKRLDSAQRRLEVATVDAELASRLLNQPAPQANKTVVKNKPLVVAPRYEVEAVEPDDDFNEDDTDENMDGEPMREEDEESEQNSDVKPLLDKDPEIIDENIAFKPISFGTPNLPVPEPVSDPEVITDNDTTDSDASNDDDSIQLETTTEVEEETTIKPVLDSMIPMPKDTELSEHDNFEQSENINTVDDFDNVETNNEFETSDDTSNMTESLDADFVAPELTTEPVVAPVIPAARPVGDMVRPMSPAAAKPAETESKPVTPVAPVGYKSEDGSKSAFIYYVLLFVLIIASVFALWAYQKKMGNGKPFLSVPGNEQQIVEPEPDVVVEKPVEQRIIEEDVLFNEQPKQKPVVEQPVKKIPQKENTEPVKKTAPVIMGAVSAQVSAFADLPAEEEVKEETPQKVEPVVNKPAYGTTSKYDDMFVYEGDEEVPEETEYIEEVVETPEVVIYQEQPQIIQSNEIVYEGDNVVYQEYPEQENYDNEFLYEEDFDEEEAAFQAGDDGYDEYHYDEY